MSVLGTNETLELTPIFFFLGFGDDGEPDREGSVSVFVELASLSSSGSRPKDSFGVPTFLFFFFRGSRGALVDVGVEVLC